MRITRRALLIGGAAAAVAAIAVLVGGYAWLTRPEALRARVLEKLRANGLADVRIGSVQFGLRSGLTIDAIEVGESDQPAHPRLANIGRAIVEGPWRKLLSGDFSDSTLRLQRAEVNLLGASAMSQADMLDSPLPAWSRLRFRFPIRPDVPLPRVVFEDTAVHIRGTEDGRLQLLERWIISGVGSPTPEGYSLALRRQRESDAELLRVQFHTSTRSAIADLGWMRVETLGDFLPEGLRAIVSPLSASGSLRVARAEFLFPADDRPVRLNSALSSVELELRDAALSLPLENGWPQLADEKLTPVADRYAQLQGLSGSLKWQTTGERGDCTLALRGRLRSAELNVLAHASPEKLAEAFRRWRGGRKLPLSVDDLETVAIQLRNLELPTAAQREALIRGDALGRTLRDMARKYDAFGRLNIEVRLPPRSERKPTTEEGRSPWEGQVEVLTGTCRYVHFPYPFENIQGHIRFAEGRTIIEGLFGTRGVAKVRLTGQVENTEAWSAFRVHASGADVPMNAELYAALPTQFHNLWGQAAPLGLADVEVDVSREMGTAESGPLAVQVGVQAKLVGGSLSTGDGRLDSVSSTVTIGDDSLELEQLLANLNGTLVRAAGWIPHSSRMSDPALLSTRPASALGERPSPQRPAAPLRVTAFDLPISYVAPDTSSGQPPLTFDGTVDLQTLWTPGEQRRAAGDRREVTLKGGSARGPGRQLVWRVQEGTLTEFSDRVILHGLSATTGPATLTAFGRFGRPISARAPLDMSLHLQSPDLPHALADLLPMQQRDWMDVLGLSGAGAVTVHLYDDATVPSAELPPRVELELESAWLRPDFFPLPMRELRACLRLNGSFYELTQCEAEMSPSASVTLSGKGVLTESGPTLQGSLSARQVRVDERFANAAPDALGDVLRALGVRGRFNVTLDQLRTDGRGAWSFQGRAEGDDAALTPGIRLTQATLSVLSEGKLDSSGEVEMHGTFRVDRGLLAGVPVNQWSGRFRVAPGKTIVYLDELRGQWCGGQVLGHARYDWDRKRYEVSLEVAGANLRQLMSAQQGAKFAAGAQAGTLSGRFDLSGYVDDPGSRVGSGAVALRDVPFRGTPILEPVARSAPQENLPVKGTPADIEMDIDVKGSRVRATRVDLTSEDLRLLGAGSYAMKDGRIDLRLFGAHPRHLPRIAGVTDLLDSAQRNLVQFRITGTIDDPKVDVTPLPLLNDALRLLLGPD